MKKNCLWLLSLALILISHVGGFARNLTLRVDHRTHAIKVEKIDAQYRWFKNDKLIIDAHEASYAIKESGTYRVEVTEKSGELSSTEASFIVTAATIIKVYTIGDSTVQDYTAGYYPRKGWGQVLQNFFNSANVQIVNKAVGGTSSKSFYKNYWTAVKNSLVAGDFVFIQFGINDRNKADTARYAPTGGIFEGYLTKFINEARAKGAFPVLVSTLRRNAWNADGVTVYDSYHDHPIAVRTVASQLNVPLIDLDAKAKVLMESLGKTYCSRLLYNNYLAGEYPNYPSGNADDVHFQEMGAIEMAKLVTKGVSELASDVNVSKLAANIRNQYTITVNKNPTGKDSVTTRTTNYPTGLTITLKTIPKKASTFTKWTNSAGTQVSTSKIYTVTSGNTTSFTANYSATSSARVALQDSTTLNVSLDPALQKRPSLKILVNNERHTISVNAIEGSKIQWFKDGLALSGENMEELLVKKGGTYEVAMTLASGQIVKEQISLAVSATGTIITIYLIGDSTVCNYSSSAYPMTGWGMTLPLYFNTANIAISNKAIGGRSSRSYYNQGRWAAVRDVLAAGDYVFIQFGHNDRNFTDTTRYTSVENYKKYLTIFVNEARAKGAIPVLVSPMVLNAWRSGVLRNVFTESGNDYRGGMLQVATALNVPFIDLNMKSWNYYKGLGEPYLTRFVYNTYPAGEYPNYPNGLTDYTHFQEMGALDNTRMIVEGITELRTKFTSMATLYQNLKPQYSITVSSTPTGKDSLTTKSNTYPAGATITLKTIPKKKSIFQKWTNAAGTQLATTTLTKLTAGAAATSYKANYSAVSAARTADTALVVAGNSEASLAVSFSPNPFDGQIRIAVEVKGECTYEIMDMSGIKLEEGVFEAETKLGNTLKSGLYYIRISHGTDKATIRVFKNE